MSNAEVLAMLSDERALAEQSAGLPSLTADIEQLPSQAQVAETENQAAFRHQLADGRVETAMSLEEARQKCPFLGKLSLAAAGLMLEGSRAQPPDSSQRHEAVRPKAPPPPKFAIPKPPTFARAEPAAEPSHKVVVMTAAPEQPPEQLGVEQPQPVQEANEALAVAAAAIEPIAVQPEPEVVVAVRELPVAIPEAVREIEEPVELTAGGPAVWQPAEAIEAQAFVRTGVAEKIHQVDAGLDITDNPKAMAPAAMEAQQGQDIPVEAQVATAVGYVNESLRRDTIVAEATPTAVPEVVADGHVDTFTPVDSPVQIDEAKLHVADTDVELMPAAAPIEAVSPAVAEVHDRLMALVEAETNEATAERPQLVEEVQPADPIDVEFAALVREMRPGLVAPAVEVAAATPEVGITAEVVALPMTEIVAAAPAQPLERTINQLKVRFEHNVETSPEPVVEAIRDLAELVAEVELQQPGEIHAKLRPTPQMTHKLLQVLEDLGYEQPAKVLLEYVHAHSFERLIEELTTLATLSLVTPENKPGILLAQQLSAVVNDDATSGSATRPSIANFLFRTLGVEPVLAAVQAD